MFVIISVAVLVAVVLDKPDAQPEVLLVPGALMHELEVILHEYLSFNWDRMEEMNTANAPLQRKEGLACPWRPSRDIDHSVRSTVPLVGYMPCPQWVHSFCEADSLLLLIAFHVTTVIGTLVTK